MQTIIGLFILTLGAEVLAQQSTTFSLDDQSQNYSFVVSLSIHLKEEMLPKLFTEFAMKNIPCTFEGCDINLVNISQALNLSRFSTEVLAEALGKVNISVEKALEGISQYNITPIEVLDILQRFGINPSDVYFDFLKTFAGDDKIKQDLAKALNVSVSELDGTNFSILQTVLNGNYNEDTVVLLNETGTELLKLFPLNTIVSKLDLIDGDEFTTLVKNLGITSDNFVEFYRHLNITPLMFLSYTPFVYTVTSIYETFNPEEVLGLLVSNDTLYTNTNAKLLEILQNHVIANYTNFYVESLENHNYSIINVSLHNSNFKSKDVATLKLPTPLTSKTIEVSTNYTNSSWINCLYVTRIPLSGLHIESLDPSRISFANNSIYVVKSNSTVYNLGSPLLCQNKLLGIASGEDARQIRLSTLATVSASGSPSAAVGFGNFVIGTLIALIFQNVLFW